MDLGVERPPRSENLKCQKKSKRMPKKQHHKETFLLKPIDLDLNRNTTKYRDSHIHRDAAEIIFHFINEK